MDDIKSVVVARGGDEPVKSGYLVTAGDAPNLIVRALSPLRVILIRTARVYVQSVMGILSAATAGKLMPSLDLGILPDEFGALVVVALKASLAIAAMTAGQNFLELLGKLDQKYPELRA